MSKHTPGEWMILTERIDGEVTYQILNIQYDASIAELEANAALIAAAPKMLERLKQFEAGGCDDFDRTQLRELIAEAEGAPKTAWQAGTPGKP